MRPHPRRGAEALEFALTLPILAVLALGTMEYGWYLHRQLTAVGAAREGARAGAVTPLHLDPEGAALGTAERLGQAAELSATVTVTREGAPPLEALRVTVTSPYEPLTGLVPVPAVNQASAVMRLEDQAPP